MEYGTLLGTVDSLTAEHALDPRRQVRFARQCIQ
jgi:hypothetical protein